MNEVLKWNNLILKIKLVLYCDSTVPSSQYLIESFGFWFLWHISHKGYLMPKYNRIFGFALVWFYGISAIEGSLMPNSFFYI